MPIVYVCGTEPGVGKTALALGLGQWLRRRGVAVRYAKLAAAADDPDLAFGAATLDHAPLFARAGVPLGTAPLEAESGSVILVEGPPDHAVQARATDLIVLVAAYRGRQTLERIAATELRPSALVLNAVPEMYVDRALQRVVPALAGQGRDVLGVVPHEQLMLGVPVRALAERLQGRWLCGEEHGERIVARLAIAGGMLQDALLWLARRPHAALICKGDRTDLPLAALQVGSAAIFLTEGLQPGVQVLAGARERGVPVVSVRQHVIHALEAVEDLFTAPPVHHPQKAAAALALVERHLALDRLAAFLGLAVRVPSAVGVTSD